jgi:hypothetical protein
VEWTHIKPKTGIEPIFDSYKEPVITFILFWPLFFPFLLGLVKNEQMERGYIK